MEFKSLKNIETSSGRYVCSASSIRQPVPRGGLLGGVRLPLRRGTAAEDIRPRRGQEPDARALAGPVAEPSGGSEGTRAPFHELFFTLSPEKSAIEHNVKRALLLADKSAYNCYADFAEKGFYNRIIAGNINQVLQVDSVVCNFDRYPYEARTYARQMIIRESNVTERTLVTACRLLNASRSDDNPNGFTIEGFTVLENKDIRTHRKMMRVWER